MSTHTTIPLGPVIDTSAPPTIEARVVEPKLPDLMFTGEHYLCAGCGEPLAMRAFLEAIEELGLAQRSICALGIGCYETPTGSELLQSGIQKMMAGSMTPAEVGASLTQGIARYYKPFQK